MWTEINGWCLNLQAQGSDCVLSCRKTAEYLLGKMSEKKKLNWKVIFPGKQSHVIYKIYQLFFFFNSSCKNVIPPQNLLV